MTLALNSPRNKKSQNFESIDQRTTIPSDNNRFYISSSVPNSNGITGYSTCTTGLNFGDKWLNTMPNCVGYACGRFNEICGSMKYPAFNCDAHGFINRARTYYPDLQISAVPTLGGIMVWESGDKVYGHVAVVEEILDNGDITISESNAGVYENTGRGTQQFWRRVRLTKSSGWIPYSGYSLMGCIVNPAVSSGNIIPLSDGGPISSAQYSEFVWPSFIKKTSTIKYITKYREQVVEVERTSLEHTDIDLGESKATNLLSYPSLVEAPFVFIEISGLKFGVYSKNQEAYNRYSVEYPNYINSLNVVKVNGTVNQYSISMSYQIQTGNDPNFLEKIFSSVGYGIIKISYGDAMSPAFIYKEEEAIITDVKSSVDFKGSRINYSITCTSRSLALAATTFNFPPRHAKPSDVIKEILYNPAFGLKDVFTGMDAREVVAANNLIASDDRAVDIQAKIAIDPVSYINYLVTCMCSQEDNTDSPIKTCTYFMSIYDDTYGNNIGGTYFKITRVKSDAPVLSLSDTYEVDIGFPSDNLVTSFDIQTQNCWSLLYSYSDKLKQDNYVYRINNSGELITEYSPALTTSTVKYKTTEAQKTWWTNMTQFPIKASLTVKGLIRPANLMTYIRVNAFFFGQRHISSGLYIITKQEDKIDSTGYKTTLELLRVAGDKDWFESHTEQEIIKIPYSVRK